MIQTLSLYEQLRFFNKTQEKFAQDVGVTVSTVNRWANGKYRPSPLAKERIREVIQRYQEERQEQERKGAA